MVAGFGPGHASAVTDRPAPRVSLFEAQTWFRDASGPGATDGTVADASFLNFIVGNLAHLCARASVDPENDQSGDTYLYDAVAALIAAALQGVAGLSAVTHDASLDGDGTVGSPLGLSEALLDAIASIGDLAALIAQEKARAIGVEQGLAERLRILEEGRAPRATPTAYGFARIGAINNDPTPGDGSTTPWVLI